MTVTTSPVQIPTSPTRVVASCLNTVHFISTPCGGDDDQTTPEISSNPLPCQRLLKRTDKAIDV